MVYITALDGKPVTLEAARKISGTTKEGTNPKPFVHGWHSLGYNARFETDLDMSRLGAYTTDYYPCIQWWSPFYRYGDESMPSGHWSVVMEVLPSKIRLYDPDFSRIVTYPLQTIEALWFDYQDNGDTSIDFVRSAVLVKKPLSPMMKTLYALQGI